MLKGITLENHYLLLIPRKLLLPGKQIKLFITRSSAAAPQGHFLILFSTIFTAPTASTFLLLVQKKGTKEKDTQRLDLVLLGSPRCSHVMGAAQLALCYALIALKQCSLNPITCGASRLRQWVEKPTSLTYNHTVAVFALSYNGVSLYTRGSCRPIAVC